MIGSKQAVVIVLSLFFATVMAQEWFKPPATGIELETSFDPDLEQRIDENGTVRFHGGRHGELPAIEFRPAAPLEPGQAVNVRITVDNRSETPLRFYLVGFDHPRAPVMRFPWHWRDGRPDIDPEIVFERLLKVSEPVPVVRLTGDRLPLDIGLLRVSMQTTYAAATNRTGTLTMAVPFATAIVASLVLFWIVPPAARRLVLLAASIAFLAWLSVAGAAAILALITTAWSLRFVFSTAQRRRPATLAIVLMVLAGVLLVYKVDWHFWLSAFVTVSPGRLLIPLGLSYFVFRIAHAVMQWYRGQHLDTGFAEFATYVLFLPTLPAGPIETLKGFRTQEPVRPDGVATAWGVRRILYGVAKKVLLVDLLLAQVLFAGNPGLYDAVGADPVAFTRGETLLFLFGMSLYAYLDFSAYSDIAIGTARLFGYRIMENFRWPVLKTNLSAFWQSWHASLTNWSRTDVHFPVLMMTRSPTMATLSAFSVMGLWHAVNINWMAWALHHAVGLVALARFSQWTRGARGAAGSLLRSPAWTLLGWSTTMAFVSLGFAFVFFKEWPIALAVYLRVIGLD